MSRLARNPINIPDDIKVSLADNVISFEGKLGKSSSTLPDGIVVDLKDNLLHFTGENKAMLGTVYANVKNEIIGNTKGFEKKLELVGTGYKANVSGKTLVLALGYSHDINFKIPDGISIKVEKNLVTVTGTSKQLVGQVAAEIKSFRKPEPYKGKGIKYSDEITKNWVMEGCKSAGIGCLECKSPVIDAVITELEPIQKEAVQYEKDPDLVRSIIADGSEMARESAKETLADVRTAMGLNNW